MQKALGESIKSKLVTNIPVVKVGETMGDVERLLIEKARSFETIDYVYAVDDGNVLRGVLSPKDVFGVDKTTKVDGIMKTELVVAHLHTHPETVVYRALSHKIKSVPIVDKEGHLLGVIPHGTILRTFNQETHKDMFQFGGIFHKVGDEYATIGSSAASMIKHRTPWLVVGVFGGAITASVVSSFESTLSTMLALASFAPVLAYLSDAVGTQSETLAVRSMALNPKLSIKSYAIRELAVAVALALVCGLLISGVAFIGWRNPLLGVIVGISMFLSVIAAVFISTVFPFLFKAFKWDPAFAAGPFATMVSDIATMMIYFLVASVLIKNPSLLT